MCTTNIVQKPLKIHSRVIANEKGSKLELRSKRQKNKWNKRTDGKIENKQPVEALNPTLSVITLNIKGVGASG